MKKFFKITISFILIVAISTSLFSNGFACSENSYEGYTPISSISDLYNIRKDLDGKYILTNDIDLSIITNWEPIGSAESPFTGEFNGNGYSIKNLTIKIGTESSAKSSDLDIGVFGLVKDAIVINLNVSNVDIDVNRENEFISIGTVASTSYNSQIHGCSSSGNICLTNYNNDASYIGGIVGYLSENTNISDCINKTNIKITKLKKDEPDNDFSFDFPGIAISGIGGISGGGFRTTLSKCINFGTITAEMIGSAFLGGIVGSFDDKAISDCCNVGDISVTGKNCKGIGGICGSSNSITNCYNAGKITANDSLEKTGAISGKTVDNAVFTNCYYSNQTDNVVSNPEDCILNNVNIVTVEELKNQNTFVGFDFENIWSMSENGYPIPVKETETDHKTIEIISCKIVNVPLKNIICTSENISPEGISIKLVYSNKSEVTHKIVCGEGNSCLFRMINRLEIISAENANRLRDI